MMDFLFSPIATTVARIYIFYNDTQTEKETKSLVCLPHQPLYTMDDDCQPIAPKTRRPSLFSFKSLRLQVTLLMMFAMFCSNSLKTSLGLTIVCMVNTTAVEEMSPAKLVFLNSQEPDYCPTHVENWSLKHAGYDGELLWDSSLQGFMFSATSFGSLLTLLPSGILADRFGPKNLILGAISTMAFMSYIQPSLANFSPYAFILSRFFMGAANGFILPSMTSLASRWFVPEERSTMNALYTSGVQICGILLGLTAPLMCQSKLLGGWPTVYYFYATVTVIWATMWLRRASNYADGNPDIAEVEMKYITENVVVKHNQKKICSILGYFACKGYFGHSTKHHVCLHGYIYPRYSESGSTNERPIHITPFMVQIFSKNLVSALADKLKREQYVSHTSSVRIFQSISSSGIASCFFGLAFLADCNHVMLGVSLLIGKNVFTSFVSPGMHTSALSIAPMHSGSVHSVTMFCASVLSTTAPFMVGNVLHNGSKSQWSNVFLAIAMGHVLSGSFFVLFGSAEAQEWSLAKKKNKAYPVKMSAPLSV
ncbi:hypothetical protein L596_019790 [Steinernema carpocapsae]|uniref:Major facilitator superfamily (MFS) profile domain-containing protein n=1 Tax=Steinernema carpocapsae TaxID=34508 RepID=A0A4U5MRN1_STECR|nr:hypothetical protein L596_019790 [Steinernema carpocapsae]